MVDEANQEKLQHCKVQASNCIEAARESLSELSMAIWSCPELAFQETQAHDTLVRFFTVKQKGWAVQSHYKLETAFRATWGPVGGKENDRPINVGFLCEYDALPDIGHACGHNLIAEVGAAAALGLRGALESLETLPVRVMVSMGFADKKVQSVCKYLQKLRYYLSKMEKFTKDKKTFPETFQPETVKLDTFWDLLTLLQLKVTVLGTPAEEDGGGKIDLIEAGAFENMDVVFMAHPSQEDAAYLPDMAEHDVTVKYYGKASHAAAYPWEGINALDAAVLAYNNLSLLRQQLKPDWRLHGSTDFGNVSFVVPGIHTYFYIGTEALNHTEEYTEATGSEKAQFYTLRTAKTLVMTALDVIFNPDIFQQVKENYEIARLKEENEMRGIISGNSSGPEHCSGAGSASR
ncbi:P20D2 protein, partial [Polypterus senegalus]|nr:P20D2 protein [Polypterus senegalus]